MGFGFLLMGFLLSMSNYPGYTDCVAFFVIFFAMLKLDEFNVFFRVSKYIAFFSAVFGMAGLMLSMGELIGFVAENNTYINLYDSASEVLKIAFGVFMLLGIITISRQTELDGQVRLGVWCIFIEVLYVLMYALSLFFPVLLPWRMLVRVIYMLAAAYLIFCCYRWICLEGDEDMSPYNSRFEIVNRLRRRLDEKAEAGNRKGEQLEEYKRRVAESRKNGVDLSRTPVTGKKKK